MRLLFSSSAGLDKHKYQLLFHINTCSFLKKNFNLDHIPKSTNEVFNIIVVSETIIITKQTSVTTNINLQIFFEFIPTESSAGETYLYIATKPHND